MNFLKRTHIERMKELLSHCLHFFLHSPSLVFKQALVTTVCLLVLHEAQTSTLTQARAGAYFSYSPLSPKTQPLFVGATLLALGLILPLIQQRFKLTKKISHWSTEIVFCGLAFFYPHPLIWGSLTACYYLFRITRQGSLSQNHPLSSSGRMPLLLMLGYDHLAANTPMKTLPIRNFFYALALLTSLLNLALMGWGILWWSLYVVPLLAMALSAISSSENHAQVTEMRN